MDDLEKVIRVAERNVETMPEDHLDLPRCLYALGGMLEEQFDLSGRTEYLQRAIRRIEEAVQKTPEGDQVPPAYLNALGSMLGKRYETGESQGQKDLEEAIRIIEQAISATPEGSGELAMRLNNLGNKLESLFDLTGNFEYLKRAIEKAEEALRSPSKSGLEWAMCSSMLANKLEKRSEHTENREDLERAIHAAEEAVKVIYNLSPYLAGMLNSLSNKLGKRYQQTRGIKDLEGAICMDREALRATSEGHRYLPGRLNNLAYKLEWRFEDKGDPEDLEEAISKAEKAVELTPENDTNLAMFLNTLGSLLGRRFEEKGDIKDLDIALCTTEKAVHITPQGNPSLPKYQTNLGNLFGLRYEELGRVEDMEKAVNHTELAVSLTPKHHSERPNYQHNLANKHMARFERMGRMEDLDEAIYRARKALGLGSERRANFGMKLSSLASKLMAKFEWTGELNALKEAICKAELAVEIAPKGHSHLAARFNSLGGLFERLFEYTGDVRNLNKAILEVKQAVRLTPKGHPNLPTYLNNLATFLRRRFELERGIKDLDEAIRNSEQAVELTPKGSPNLAFYLNTHGRNLSLSSDASQGGRALVSFLLSWDSQNGIPFIRIDSARRATLLLRDQGDWNKASEIAAEALKMVPVVVSRSLNRDNQQHVVSLFSGLAADACSLSLEVDENAGKALQLLEHGRAVILGLVMDDRSDISHLEKHCPEKAGTYERLRTEVNMPIYDTEDPKERQRLARRRIAAVKELEDCIHQIREIPGYDRFLRGPTLEELKQQAAEGPIVVVNITDIRSDAIIISAAAIQHINLAKQTASKAEKWIQQDLTSFVNIFEYGQNNRKYCLFLLWLWLACVKPVLEKLGLNGQPASSGLTRIWWIGVGIASYLPFHAAGDHASGSTENTFHHAISSYTPTIKALQYARECVKRASTFHQDKSKLLIVSMPTTPGESDLDVAEEKSNIPRILGDAFSHKPLDSPSAQMVLDNLPHFDMVHFTCHGVSDPSNPSKSSLILQRLQDGASLPMRDNLTVQHISGSNLKRARIAYLSACSTAENKVKQLTDEVIHIASSFQVAGFGHVIGAMWPSESDVSTRVAMGFYQRLKASDCDWSNPVAFAKALHESLMDVRSGEADTPLGWAQHIHLGA